MISGHDESLVMGCQDTVMAASIPQPDKVSLVLLLQEVKYILKTSFSIVRKEFLPREHRIARTKGYKGGWPTARESG
eukprot:1149953-Pelagomonas_calceolata.AAC.2